MEQNLTTVHDALKEASTEVKRDEAMITYTFRIREHVRDEAERLCKMHGTTLPDYLRKCCELLPKDYRP